MMRSLLALALALVVSPAFACPGGAIQIVHDAKLICVGNLTAIEPAVCMVKTATLQNRMTFFDPRWGLTKAQCDALSGEYRTATVED